MWENSFEKLKILNYEKDFCKKFNRKPFHRVQFVLPAANANNQFEDFYSICSWLCSEITKKSDTFKPEQFDDPNTIVNKLLLALRQLDFRSNFPPQKFKTPYGEPVCMVLDFLTDKALAAKGFQFAAPVYANMDDAEQPQGGDEDEEENEEIVEEDAHGLDAGENEEQLLNSSFEENNLRLDSSVDMSTHNIIQAAIDPIEWKTELERVGPKLKANVTLSTNEWRSHVDQTIGSKEQIEKVMSGSHSELQMINK
jgi:estrogen-related receptor beta like 1